MRYSLYTNDCGSSPRAARPASSLTSPPAQKHGARAGPSARTTTARTAGSACSASSQFWISRIASAAFGSIDRVARPAKSAPSGPRGRGGGGQVGERRRRAAAQSLRCSNAIMDAIQTIENVIMFEIIIAAAAERGREGPSSNAVARWVGVARSGFEAGGGPVSPTPVRSRNLGVPPPGPQPPARGDERRVPPSRVSPDLPPGVGGREGRPARGAGPGRTEAEGVHGLRAGEHHLRRPRAPAPVQPARRHAGPPGGGRPRPAGRGSDRARPEVRRRRRG